MYDMGRGLGTSVGNGGPILFRRRTPVFDFKWNMRRRSTTANYGMVSAGDPFLARACLGNQERNDRLTFRRPWLIPMGDGVTFTVKPLGFNFRLVAGDARALDMVVISGAVNSTQWKYTVHMMMEGFRVNVK
jgi:hypothetical protein